MFFANCAQKHSSINDERGNSQRRTRRPARHCRVALGGVEQLENRQLLAVGAYDIPDEIAMEIGFDGVVRVNNATGALLHTGQHILTAAHSVSVNETQLVDVTATGGSFTLSFGGETTPDIAFDASNDAFKDALEALSSINRVEVTDGDRDNSWKIEFTGYVRQDLPELTADAGDLEGTDADVSIETDRDGGPLQTVVTFHLPEADGGTVEFNVPPENITLHPGYWLNNGAINDMAIVDLGVIAPLTADRYDIYMDGDEAGQEVQLAGYGATGTGTIGSASELDNFEVQRIHFSNTPTGGSFDLQVFPETLTVPYDVTQDELESMIEDNVDSINDVYIRQVGTLGNGQGYSTPNPLAGDFEIVFVDSAWDEVEMQIVDDNLTGASVSVSTPLQGGAPRLKRGGLNRIMDVSDFSDDVVSDKTNWLYADFDDGSTQADWDGDLGFGDQEAFLTNGDSGSPVFIDGRIAGVHKGRTKPGIDGVVNTADFGEWDRYARVSTEQSFINTVTAGTGMYELVLDMNFQIEGNDGTLDTVAIDIGGDQIEISINGVVKYTHDADVVSAVHLRGSADNEVFQTNSVADTMPVFVVGRGGDDTLDVEVPAGTTNMAEGLWFRGGDPMTEDDPNEVDRVVIYSAQDLTLTDTSLCVANFSCISNGVTFGDTIERAELIASAGSIEFDALSYSGGDNGSILMVGGVGNDRLLTNDADAFLVGGNGNDTLQAGMGDDNTYVGGPGHDELTVEGYEFEDSHIDLDMWGTQVEELYVRTFLGEDTIIVSAPNGMFIDVHAGAADDEVDLSDAASPTLVRGDWGNDELIGSESHANEMYGGFGDDYLEGGRATDLLNGGGDDDTIIGARGDDELFGADGDDLIIGDLQTTEQVTSNDDDYIEGGAGDDIVIADSGDINPSAVPPIDADPALGGNDTVLGGAGADTIFGQGGMDHAEGNEDGDEIFGGDGDDFLVGGSTVCDPKAAANPCDPNLPVTAKDDGDRIDGGANADEIYGDNYSDDLGADEPGGEADELIGGAGGDTIFGQAGADEIQGLGGADYIDAGAGDDVVTAGSQGDTVFGRDGNDRIAGERGHDTISGGEGSDTLSGDAGADDLSGDNGHDQLSGGSADDTLDGGNGDDIVEGEGGSDELYGGPGSDEMLGGDGEDTLQGNQGDDLLVGGNGSDTALGGDGDDTLIGDQVSTKPALVVYGDHLRGDAGDDLILGDSGLPSPLFVAQTGGNDFIFGGTGSDLVYAQGGDDMVSLDEGHDVAFAGEGNDFVEGGNGNDRMHGHSGNDLMFGHGGSDVIRGDGGDDTVHGGDGADVLLGGADDDQLTGENGRDVLIGGIGSDQLNGGADDDIMVSGWTSHDKDDLALLDILAEWTAMRFYVLRVWNLSNVDNFSSPLRLNSKTFLIKDDTVFDDKNVDFLTGGSDRDWFLMDPLPDVATDLVFGEHVN